MNTRIVLVLVSTLFLVGCQSEKAGFEVICHAADHVELGDVPADRKAVVLAEWIDAELSNEAARNAWKALAQAAPDQKAELLENSARQAGVSPCPLSSIFEVVEVPAPSEPEPEPEPEAESDPAVPESEPEGTATE